MNAPGIFGNRPIYNRKLKGGLGTAFETGKGPVTS